MKIKKSRKRIILRFLARVGIVVMIIIVGCFISVRRISGNVESPDFRDGDLVFEEKWGGKATFLLVRVRGFEE